MSNDPFGPFFVPEQRLRQPNELIERIRARIKKEPKIPYVPSKSPIFRTPVDGGGVRGSLDKRSVGIDLVEASPAMAMREVILSQSNLLAGEVIHMQVEAKGDEDWIELAANGSVFMKLPLTNYNIGEIYEIDIPSGLLTEGVNLYSYFLNSTGAVNSRVFFPVTLPEDVPPTIGSCSITNSVFTLQLTNLVHGFDYFIQQSLLTTTNWQPVTSFTATNDFQSLSVPMTNSLMFYRATISPP
jgi:hypothetical protein